VRNEHFSFLKVVMRHYFGKVGNVYMIFRQIYSGNHVPNFIRLPEFYRR